MVIVPFDPVVLEGVHVLLEPLGTQHRDSMMKAVSEPRDSFALTWVPEATESSIEAYLGEAERQHADGLGLTFATVRKSDGVLVGSTRFMNAEYWSKPGAQPDSPQPPDALEIGSTWLAASAQRTGVNTEAKILMLDHAFNTLGVARVTFKTDARNQRSRANIERVGATFEGILRSHMPASDGGIRDSAMYSMLASEWLGARSRLVARLRPVM